MKTNTIFLLSLLVAIFFSCSSKKNQNENTNSEVKEEVDPNPFLTIDFAEIIKDQKEVSLSEIAERVESVSLENSDKALLGNVLMYN